MYVPGVKNPSQDEQFPHRFRGLCNMTELSFEPTRILEIEISEPLPTVSAFNRETSQCYRRAMVLVRFHTRPLGIVGLELGEAGLNAAECARQCGVFPRGRSR
jgi:hypothetical protein